MSQKPSEPLVSENEIKSKRRQATVYDAVAGRVGLNGFIDDNTEITPLTPAEALLRRVDAPNDLEVYNAHIHLNQHLPDSDLLHDIHRYASEFYARHYTDQDAVDVHSLDETALLAFGILLEETCRDCLGSTGDLALTESQRPRDRKEEERDFQIIGRVIPSKVAAFKESSSDDSEVEQPQKKRRRRRRYEGT